MRLLVVLWVLIWSVVGVQAQTNGFTSAAMNPSAPIEFIGVVSPDSIDLFLVEDLPDVLNRTSQIVARTQWAERITPDTITSCKSDRRYLSYLKINEQYYGYFIDAKRMKGALSALFLGLPTTAMLLASNDIGVSALQLAVDYTLCIYDTHTGIMQVQHPFLFATTQAKKDGREVQVMQPDFIPVDYPLADELLKAIAAEYMKICREYGYISK